MPQNGLEDTPFAIRVDECHRFILTGRLALGRCDDVDRFVALLSKVEFVDGLERFQASADGVLRIGDIDTKVAIGVVAGLPLRPDLHCDGVSSVPLLKGEDKPLHDALFWHYPHYASYGCGPYSAIRSGDWKLIEWLEDGSVDLFNLGEDLGEQNNLADVMPEKVNELRSQIHQWRKDVEANMPRPR